MSIFVHIQSSAAGREKQESILLFDIDFQTYLLPTLLQIPTEHKTMESLIAQKRDDHILFLNELKFKQQTALKFKIPLTDTSVIAVKAAFGREGIAYGKDYMNKDVLACISKIKGTPWFMITKVDMDEINAPILRGTAAIIINVLLGIIITGVIIVLAWRSQRAKHYRILLEKESEKKVMAEHYAYLSKFANDIILLDDENLNIIEANDKAVECYKYTKDELLNLNVKDIRAPGFKQDISNIESEVKKTGGTIFETMHVRKDSSTFPAEVSTRVINIEGKKYYQSIIRDITERKKAEELLKKNEILTNAVIDNSPVGITIRANNGNLISYNHAWLKLWGLTPEKVEELEENSRKQPLEERFTILGREAAKVLNIIKTGRHQFIPEIKIDNPYNNKILWISMYLYAITLDGKVERIVTITQDITDRKTAEENLKSSEAHHRSIIEHSTILFYSHNTDHKITYVSPQVRDFLDCEPEEALINWSNFTTDNPVNELGYFLTKKAIDTAMPQPPYELELLGRKGRIIWVEVHESPVVVNGKTVAVAGSLTDITSRKKAEEKIIKLNRFYRVLSEANKTIVKIKDEKELFEKICEILVELGKFRMVWVAEIDPDTTRIKPLAVKGFDEGYIDILLSHSTEILGENEPFFYSIKKKKVLVFNRLDDDLSRPWGGESIKRGYNSYCIMPVFKESKRNIVLNLYAGEKDFFSKDEMDVITELTADISFALSGIEQDRLRMAAEGEVVSTKQMLEKITSTTPAYISVYDIKNEQTLYHNTSIMERLGYSKEQIRKIWKMTSEETDSFYHPDDLANAREMDKRTGQLKDDEVFKTEYRLRDSKGNWHWFEHSTRVFLRNKIGIPTQTVNIIMDIDERKQSDEMVLQANRKLKILYEAGKKLGATLDISKLYNSMYEYVSLIADCSDMFVAVYDETEKTIKYSFLKSKESENNIDVSKIPPIPLAPPGYGILSEVIRSGKSQLFNDYQKILKKSKVQYSVDQKGELTQPVAGNSESDGKPRSAILVPIKLDNKVFAVVQIFSLQENAYTAEQLELVESLMHQVALANKNVLLFQRAQDEILERIKAEEALKKSEERFSVAFKLSPIPISLTRLDDGTFIDINDAFIQLLGYTYTEVKGLKTTDVNIWDADTRNKTITALKEKGLLKDIELRIRNKKGEPIDTLSTLQVIKIGGEDCLIAMLMDITERKKSEEQVRKLSRAVEQSAASIIITDLKGDIEYVNPKFSEMSGYEAQEAIGKNPRILKSGMNPEELYVDLWKTISSGREWHGELQNKRKDGDLYWEWASISPIFDSKGLITNYLAVKEDITINKLIQDQIRLQAILLENITDAVISVDHDHNINSWNSGAEKMYEWKAREVVGKNLMNVLKPEFVNESSQAVLKYISKNNTWLGEVLQTSKDGKKINVLSSTSTLRDQKGTITGYVSVNRDITERKLHEEKLKTSLKEKEILLKEIHHRVKNNLQVISSLLKMQTAYIKDPLALDYFKISSQRVKSMALIHEQLYRSADLSKIDFENYIKKLSTHLYQTYGVSSSKVRFAVKVHDIMLEIDTAIPCGLLVNELISNSLKHGFPENKIGKIEVEMEKIGNKYVLKVSDTGKGFPKNIDFQNTETLGMQLVNTLIEQIEGTVELKNNNGTEFTITFKAHEYKKRI